MIRLLFLTTLTNIARSHSPAKMPLQAVDFEVFGIVQGVFFRKAPLSTQKELNSSEQLNLPIKVLLIEWLPKVIITKPMGGKSTKVVCPPGQELVTLEAPLDTFDFEVFFFKSDKKYFPKYTKEQADKLGIRGWCMNTNHGTVVGHVQGTPQSVHEMRRWLRSTGSPESTVDRVNFTNESEIPDYTFDKFEIRK